MTEAPASADRGRARPGMAAGLATLLTVSLTGQAGVLSGAQLIGAGTADVWGHAWGYDIVAHRLFSLTPPLDPMPTLFPDGQLWWIVDLPIALLLAPITAIAGPALSLNLAGVVHVALGAAALCSLLQRTGLKRTATIAGAAVALAPFTRGALASGIPEALAVLFLPAFALWLYDALRGEAGPLFLAASMAALLAMDGMYALMPGAIVGIGLLLHALVGAPARGGVLMRGVFVALPAAAAVAWQLANLHIQGHPALATSGLAAPILPPHQWVQAPLGGADLFNFFAPRQTLPTPPESTLHHHTVYLGPILILASIWACVRPARHPPFVRGAALIALVACAFSVGATLHIGGEPLRGWTMPGWLLRGTGALNVYRTAGLAVVALIAAVTVGLPKRARPVVLGLCFIDWLALSPAPLPTPTVSDPAGPVERWLAEGEGGVLDLPTDRDGHRTPGPWPQRVFYLQTIHRRPIASGIHRRSRLSREAPLISHIDRAMGHGWASPRAIPHYPKLSAVDAHAFRARLHTLGFTSVTLDQALVPLQGRAPTRALLEQLLGPPEIQADERLGWHLRAPATPAQ